MKVCGVLVICSILCVLKFGNAENSFIFTSPEVIYGRNTAYFTLLVSGIPSGGKVTVNLLRKNDSVVLSQSNVDVIPNRRVLVAMFVPHITDVNVATLHIFGNFSDGYKIDDKRDVSIQIDYFTVIQAANRERTTANPDHSLQYTTQSFPTGSYNTTPIPEVCEYDLSSTRGVVSSPNYPDFYPKSMDCRWKFETAPGHRIKLAFNFFELEPGIKCQYDNVTLYDGNSTDTPLLAKFCGSSLPPIVTSRTHILLMTFHSDLSIEKHGFQALHSSVCGGQLTAAAQPAFIYSHPNYGLQNYDNNLNCTWTVTSVNSRMIRITFQTSDLEQEQDCLYDYVEIRDEVNNLLLKHCGHKIPPAFVFPRNHLFIHFRTDDKITEKGFVLSYSEYIF